MSCLRVLPKISVVALLATPILFVTQTSHAAGFQINETSPALQGAAMAGAAAAENDVSAMLVNPATLATLQQNQFYIGASVILPMIKMSEGSATHDAFVPGSIPPIPNPTAIAGSTSQRNIANSAIIPSSYFGWRINDRVVVGMGLSAPWGLSTHYDLDSVLRYAAIESSVKTINFNPALAFKFNDQWSFGAGLQAQYAQAKFSNFNGGYINPNDPDLGFLAPTINSTYPTNLSGDGWGYGYNLGIFFTPRVGTHLGLGYRSEVKEKLSGSGQQYVRQGDIVPIIGNGYLFPYNSNTSVSTEVRTPAVLHFGITQDINDWTLKASAQLNFWNCFNQLDINMPDAYATNSTVTTDWHNAWLYSLGADYHPSPKWTLRAGVAYDQTPTRNQFRDPRIPDADRIWATTGFSYKMTKQLAIDAAYEHIFIKNQSVNVTQSSGTNNLVSYPLETNTSAANYKGYVDILALAVRYSF